MTSCVVLYNCVVLFVVFGSVVCTGNTSTSDGSSEPDHWMKGLEIQYVNFQDHYGKDKDYRDALFKAKFHEDTKTWCWDYYDAEDWHEKFGVKRGAKPAGSLPVDLMTVQTRADATVLFFMRGGNRYIANFATEKDARTFNRGR